MTQVGRKPVLNVRNAKPFKAMLMGREYWINGSPERLVSYKCVPVDRPYIMVTDPKTGANYFLRIDNTGTYKGFAVKVCNPDTMSQEELDDSLTLHDWELCEDQDAAEYQCKRCGNFR